MRYQDNPVSLEEVRPRHREYILGLIAHGQVLIGGSFVPDGEGGLFLYDAEDRAAAENLISSDPYVIEGVAASWTLREYVIHGSALAALRPK